MLNVLKSSLFAVFLLAGYGVYSQQDSTMKFSLTEAQNFAIENYYASKNAKLDIVSAKKQVMEIRRFINH
jgi:archaellum component FlaF (FlaF/FlaG flagellin family)